MTRTPFRRALAATTLSAAAAACAGRPLAEPDAPAAAPATRDVAAQPVRRPAPPSTDEIDAWIAAHDGTESPAVRRAMADRILAAGEPALDRLVARLNRHAVGDELAARSLVVRSFGARAVPKLVVELGSGLAHVREAAAQVLARMAGTWAHSDMGPDVCRALLRSLPRTRGVFRNNAVARAIAVSHGAGRAIVRDLGERWLAGGEDAHDAALLIAILGAEAAPEASACARWALAEVGSADDDRAGDAFLILDSFGSSDLTLLPDLMTALDAAPPDRRASLLGVFATWGDAAAPAIPRLVRLLRDRDEEVRDAAAHALGCMPRAAETVWRDLVGAAVNGCQRAKFALWDLARRTEFAARLAEWLPSLVADEIAVVYDALYHGRAFDMVSLAPMLMRHPLAAARYEALVPWEPRDYGDREERPIPEGALALLSDDDAGVRAFAANVLAARRAAPDGRLREVAMAVRTADDPDARADAIRALGALATRDAAPLEPIVEALSDPEHVVRAAAIDAIVASGREVALPAIPAVQEEIALRRAALASALADNRPVAVSPLDAALHGDHRTLPVENLLRMRDEGTVDERAAAAVALWRRTRRREDAMPTLRAILAEPDRIDRRLPWDDMGAALAEMRVGVEELPAVVATLRSAADLRGEYDPVASRTPGDWGWIRPPQRPRSSAQPLSEALAALIPTLEPLGTDAAPAVSALRAVVSPFTYYGERAVQVLGAIGAPARDAIPCIRLWAAGPWADVELARQAIAKIESAPR